MKKKTQENYDMLMADYHFASSNSIAYKYKINQHLVHYSDSVLKLMSDSRARTSQKGISLPPVEIENAALREVILNRSSSREFGTGISFEELSCLLHYSNGFKDKDCTARYVPSSGGLFSTELYPLVFDTKGIESGLYHHNAVGDQLEIISAGNYRSWARENVFFQKEFSSAAAAIIITSHVGRLTGKYGLRGYRLALLDVGHVSQQIYLLASQLKLKVCATAGFIDDEVNSAIKVNGIDESAFLVMLIGK